MDLIVDHPRQQPAPVRIDHGVACARGQRIADFGDAGMLDAEISFKFAAFIDKARIDNQRSAHGDSFEEWPHAQPG